MKILVVGAGFAGATTARELAEAGHTVVVIDARDHVAGNAYDYVNEHGIRVHKYGPHLWHTSNEVVHEWASRFTEWTPYQHRVRALVPGGKTVPLPINPETIETVFGQRFFSWCHENGWAETPYGGLPVTGSHARFLDTLVARHTSALDSRQHVENSVGQELCELFFAPYTKKMWGLKLEELPASVAARIPTNVESGSTLYFPNDRFQFLPTDGYTAMVQNILDHKNIQVSLETTRQEFLQPNLAWYWQERLDCSNLDFDHVFTSEPIDTYFDCTLGELPWRSVKMHVQTLSLVNTLPSPVLNFTHNGPITRVTEWKQLPAHGSNEYCTTLTFEEPCDYRDNNMERYYPVKVAGAVDPNRELLKRYQQLTPANVTFIGRCGQYVYTDMAPCISSTLAIVRKFLKELT